MRSSIPSGVESPLVVIFTVVHGYLGALLSNRSAEPPGCLLPAPPRQVRQETQGTEARRCVFAPLPSRHDLQPEHLTKAVLHAVKVLVREGAVPVVYTCLSHGGNHTLGLGGSG